MTNKELKFNDLIIRNVPDNNSFIVALNIEIIKAEMQRLGIKECDYQEFCKIYK